MTERTDHVAKAKEWLAMAKRPELTMQETSSLAEVAGVHATLALVEQQRIANLIALVALSGNAAVQESDFDEGATLSSGGMHGLIEYERTPATPFGGPDEVPVMRAVIREALGL